MTVYSWIGLVLSILGLVSGVVCLVSLVEMILTTNYPTKTLGRMIISGFASVIFTVAEKIIFYSSLG